jgi:hypothetical protein
VASHCCDWAKRFPEALWAYRTTWKNTTCFSPFKLVYGKSHIFPIEFEIKTRPALEVNLDLTIGQKHRSDHLNELDEMCLAALHHINLVQQQRTEWHDKFIKNKVF